jgi:16S rRNA (cytosine1402-N4)-methyltransferase
MARQRLSEFEPQVTLLHDNYRNLPRMLSALGIERIDGLLLDLGMSSVQVDCAKRGFSFLAEGQLDMRMDQTQSLSAQSLLSELSADEIAHMLQTLGEERFARRIAAQIIQARRAKPMMTTTELARVIASALPGKARHGRLHPATRTFQALRIAVNDELGALEELLGLLPELLNVGGSALILTFHSLEDRLVKRCFIEGSRALLWTVLTKKPIRPTAEEVARNPRSRSAKLRAVKRR